MKESKPHFLFVLVSCLVIQAQVLSPVGNCFGACLTCDPLSLSHCQGIKACEQGFYNSTDKGTCTPNPTLTILSNQLGERGQKQTRKTASGWGSNARLSVCQYSSPQGMREIDVLGFFQGIEMLEKIYEVDPYSEFFEFSFNLVHDEWLPFNDFMIIDFASQNENIQSAEISYNRRQNVNTQAAEIVCDGKRVINEKFVIKLVNNNNRIGQKLTVLFTSFLYDAIWGISNIRLTSGCTHYTMFDQKTQTCSKCDSDSFLLADYGTKICQKCPLLCTTCETKTKCLTCVQGATKDSAGICVFPEQFKTQLVPLGGSVKICGDEAFKLGSLQNAIAFQQLKNDKDQLFDELQVGFLIYYFPSDWTSEKDGYLSVKLNKEEIMQLNFKNFINKATTECKVFKKNNMARVQIFSAKITHNDNVAALSFELNGSDKQFGVGEIRVKSIIKTTSSSQKQTQPLQTPVQKEPQVQPVQQKAEPIEDNQTAAVKEEPVKQPELPLPVKSLQEQKEISAEEPTQLSQPATANQQQKQQSAHPRNKTEQTPKQPSQSAQPQETSIEPSKQNQLDDNRDAKIIQQMIKDKEDSPNIGFLPAYSGSKSGLQLYIDNQPEDGDFLYNAFIDKLDPAEYEIDSYYMQEGRLNMFIKITNSFVDGSVAIYRYSAKTRLLQEQEGPTLAANFKISRFDSLSESQIQIIENFALIFQVLAWIGVISIIVATMSGYGIVVEEYIIALQIMFLHVYIAADFLPLTFRNSIGGLNIIQNLNFFIFSHGKAIENQWMGNVLQNGPVRFFLFNTDINFLRQFYPVIIVNLIFLCWFGLLKVASYMLNRNMPEEKSMIHKVVDNIALRTINFLDGIWRYQFLATMWISFVQFHNFTYPEGSNRSPAINAVICILSFLCSLAWPIFLNFYCRTKYYNCQYSEYLNCFEDIYYLKIPKYELPSNHHRTVYPLLRPAKMFLIALIICYAGEIPTLTLLFLLILNAAEIFYIRWQEIYSDYRYFVLKVIENAFFIVIDFLLLTILNMDSLASSDAYIYLGFFLAAISFLMAINAIIRMFFLAHQKYLQAVENNIEQFVYHKRHVTDRVV